MVFSIRADTMLALSGRFSNNNLELIGAVAGIHFLGFAAFILIGSPLCDAIGMRTLLLLACLLHLGGIALTIFAPSYNVLWGAAIMTGCAHGLVEAVINPLIATLYAEDKTNKLNILHAWWPAGIIIGTLLAYTITQIAGPNAWEVKMAVILLPVIGYGLLILGQKFPPTERVASGISTGQMFRDVMRPMFVFLCLCMVLTATTEFGPNQYMESVLQQTANTSGTLVLGYISAFMFVMRFFAGPIAHRISPVGLLVLSAILATIGLFSLSYANTTVTAFAAATVFATGICYFWPTMLGVTSEQFPRGGALALGIIGTMATGAMYFVLPYVGRIFDIYGPARAFRYVTFAPVVLIVAFGALYAYFQTKGGYRAVRIEDDGGDRVYAGAADTIRGTKAATNL